MSAIDRAFIKAYSDEVTETVEHPSAQAKPAAADSAKATAASVKSTPAANAQTPRRTASRAKRAASAAAIRGPEQDPIAAAPRSDIEPIAASPPATLATVGGNKAKMVVGRQALKQLAETASVPPPHAAFVQKVTVPKVTVVASHAEQQPAPAVSAAARTGSLGTPAKRLANDAPRSEAREPVSAVDANAHQFRVDPARSAAAEPPVAALEVDRLVWPQACEAIIDRALADFESVAAQLSEQVSDCGAAIAVVSIDKGHGGTTVAMCLARILAQRGPRVCLVDGDCRQPGLAESLGLETEQGLESVLSGDATLADILVESLEDQLMLLPLSRPLAADAVERSKLRQTVTFGELRDQFDVVLIDAGCVDGTPALRPSMLGAGLVDSVILVGRETADAATWQRARQALVDWNVPCLGVIANRCAA